MAVLKRDEFFNRLESQIHNDTSDDAISFLEDMQDTYNDLERRAAGDGEDWEKKYHDLDETWRARYKHRFFNGSANREFASDDDNKEAKDDYDPEEITVESLFKESEVK